MYVLSLEVLQKKLKLNLSRADGPRTEQKLWGPNENCLRWLIYIENEKSVPPVDITYVCIIIRGTTKKIKIKFI